MGLVNTPAPFFPLDDNTTPASRLCGQSRAFGFEPVIGMAKIGYPYRAHQPRDGYFQRLDTGESIESILAEIGVDPDDSPWTEERRAYAASLGQVVEVSNPGWRDVHDTFCTVMDTLPAFELLFMVQGDTLLSSTFLKWFMTQEPPCQFVLCPNHAVFLLNPKGVEIYRQYTDSHRDRAKTPDKWVATTQAYPDGPEGTGYLQQVGLASLGWNHTEWRYKNTDCLWFDIDHGLGYRQAVERIKKGWYQ